MAEEEGGAEDTSFLRTVRGKERRGEGGDGKEEGEREGIIMEEMGQ